MPKLLSRIKQAITGKSKAKAATLPKLNSFGTTVVSKPTSAGPTGVSAKSNPAILRSDPSAQNMISAMGGETKATPAKKMSFKETFAAERKAGKKEFEYGGKKYNTNLASSAPKAETKKSEPATKTSSSVSGETASPKATTKSPSMSDSEVKNKKISDMGKKADEKRGYGKPSTIKPGRSSTVSAGGFKLKTKNVSKP